MVNIKAAYNAMLIDIANRFDLSAPAVTVVPYGSGHINETYAVAVEGSSTPRYVLQRLNHRIFKDHAAVMDNILLVTQELHKVVESRGGNPLEESLTMLRTRDSGNHYFTLPAATSEIHPDETYWRCYFYIDGKTYEVAPSGNHGVKLAYVVGSTFGGFIRDLSGRDMSGLRETIPKFHNGPDRYAKFLAALEADPKQRKESCKQEVDFVLQREYMAHIIAGMLENGLLPIRVTHNDTKLNNVRVGKNDSAEYGKCVLDLDTVMPGTLLYDFGDMVRTGAATAVEDEVDLSKVGINLALFQQLGRGFISAMGGSITANEKENLVFSSRFMTFLIGMRFLTDYLAGDVYFRIHKPSHNLDRARTQFRMVEEMEGKVSMMEDILLAN